MREREATREREARAARIPPAGELASLSLMVRQILEHVSSQHREKSDEVERLLDLAREENADEAERLRFFC